MTTLTEAKVHLRVLHDDEDPLIDSLLQAAQEHVAKYLGDDMPDPVPAPVEAAILLLVGDLYENRERRIDRVFYDNSTYDLLLNPYRSMGL